MRYVSHANLRVVQRAVAPQAPLSDIHDRRRPCAPDAGGAGGLADVPRVPRHRLTQPWLLPYYVPLQGRVLLRVCGAVEALWVSAVGRGAARGRCREARGE